MIYLTSLTRFSSKIPRTPVARHKWLSTKKPTLSAETFLTTLHQTLGPSTIHVSPTTLSIHASPQPISQDIINTVSLARHIIQTVTPDGLFIDNGNCFKTATITTILNPKLSINIVTKGIKDLGIEHAYNIFDDDGSKWIICGTYRQFLDHVVLDSHKLPPILITDYDTLPKISQSITDMRYPQPPTPTLWHSMVSFFCHKPSFTFHFNVSPIELKRYQYLANQIHDYSLTHTIKDVESMLHRLNNDFYIPINIDGPSMHPFATEYLDPSKLNQLLRLIANAVKTRATHPWALKSSREIPNGQNIHPM